MIMNIIILAVLLFLVYLSKDRISLIFKRDDVNKPFDNKSYDLRTSIESYTDEISGHFLTANFNVTTSNLSRKDVVIKDIKFYANRVMKDNYAFNDEHELIVMNEKVIEKMLIPVPQSRNAVQKFDNDFKLYVNEVLTFSFSLHCNSMSLLLKNLNVNEMTLSNWMYFISVEVELVDGTVSKSNKIPLTSVIDNITRIAHFDLEAIGKVMEVVDQKDAEEQAKRNKYKSRNVDIQLNDGGNMDEFLILLNNQVQTRDVDTTETEVNNRPIDNLPPHIREILGLNNAPDNEIEGTNDDNDND